MGTWARQTLAGLSLEEKVGQVICYRPNRGERETVALAAEGRVGAASPTYFAGMAPDPARMLAFMNELNQVSSVPVLFFNNLACEYSHWGATPLPGENSTMALGATRDPDLVERVAYAAAWEAKRFGLDCVWVPCVDVNTNPANPIIGTRAFGDRPRLVADLAAAYVRGMQRAGVIPNAKHFPGHGDTAFDTHEQVGVIAHDRPRLDRVELLPYRRLIRQGLRGVMTAHLIVPALDDTPGLPATLSRACIHGLLRQQLKFGGLIVSDSLSMRAIRDNVGVEEAVVRTFLAGHDVIMQDYHELPRPSWEALARAVRDGRVPMAQLDDSVLRVLEAKEWAGLPGRPPLDWQAIRRTIADQGHLALAREVFGRAVTVLDRQGLPLPADGRRLAVISALPETPGPVVTDLSLAADSGSGRLQRAVAERAPGSTWRSIAEAPDPQQVEAALAAVAAADTVVFACGPRIVAYDNEASRTSSGQIALVGRLLAAGKTVCLAVLGNPYVITDFPRPHACVTTYSGQPEAVSAAVSVLFGDTPAAGRLPLDLPGRYRCGRGLSPNLA